MAATMDVHGSCTRTTSHPDAKAVFISSGALFICGTFVAVAGMQEDYRALYELPEEKRKRFQQNALALCSHPYNVKSLYNAVSVHFRETEPRPGKHTQEVLPRPSCTQHPPPGSFNEALVHNRGQDG